MEGSPGQEWKVTLCCNRRESSKVIGSSWKMRPHLSMCRAEPSHRSSHGRVIKSTDDAQEHRLCTCKFTMTGQQGGRKADLLNLIKVGLVSDWKQVT